VIQEGEFFGSNPTHLQFTKVKSSLTYWEKLLDEYLIIISIT
jgi:hypothetical protein